MEGVSEPQRAPPMITSSVQLWTFSRLVILTVDTLYYSTLVLSDWSPCISSVGDFSPGLPGSDWFLVPTLSVAALVTHAPLDSWSADWSIFSTFDNTFVSHRKLKHLPSHLVDDTKWLWQTFVCPFSLVEWHTRPRSRPCLNWAVLNFIKHNKWG